MLRDFEYGGLLYKASDDGEIFGVARNKKIKKRLNKDGYYVVTLGIKDRRTSVKVHRIIAKVFVDGYFDGAEVNHKDFDRKNNRAENLEWVTHLYNVRFSSSAGHYGNGRHSGTNNGRSKINSEIASEIRTRYKNGESINSISKKYGICWTQTKRIIDNMCWKQIGM